MNHTEPTAKAQSRRTGLFATLRGLLHAEGSGAPSRALLLISLIALAALLVPAAAQASPPTLVPDGQFHSRGAVGVAVDNSSGPFQNDVYTGAFFTLSETEGTGLGEVNKFDPSGNLISPPSPFGVAHEFGDKGLSYAGAAVNPVNGDLYVLDAYFSEIDVFDPETGALESSFPVAASNNFELLIPWTMVGIATDSAGNVYVPVVPENEVLEYSPAGALLETFTGGSGSGALSGPTAVALDPSGNLWVADTGNGRIEELSHAGAPLAEISVEGTLQSLVVDPQGHLFATVKNGADFCGSRKPPCSHLIEYSSAGDQLADLGAGEYGGDEEAEPPTMVAVNHSTGHVYVTDRGNNRVLIYVPPTPPQIESELAVGVTTSEAKLGALVNPGGIGSSYRFEYGTTTAYGQTAPSPEGDAGTGFKPRTVWASPSGLQPGTTYHYRIVVANELGEVKGADKAFTTATAAQAACPNEQFRSGFSASLPDCRAYELVTLPNKLGAQPDKNQCANEPGNCSPSSTLRGNLAAPDGNRLQFNAEDVLPGSPGGGELYLATRGPAGWSLENQIPPTNYFARECTLFTGTSAHSEDLSKVIVSGVSGGICGIEPELVSGEPRGTVNLFLRDNTTGAYQLINLTPPGVTPANAEFLAASADLGRVVFKEQAQLTPGALSGVENLYEWSAGQLHLLTLLPGTETPVAGSFKAISADGSHVFFTAEGNLCTRVNGTETVQLDASQAAGPGGGGHFLAASADGSRVYITDDASAALTADTVPGSGTNLYLYDFTAPDGHRLTDLTPVANAGAPELNGISQDGSRVYFTDDASAALTADTVPGSGTNLYFYAAGQLTDLTPAPLADVGNVTVSQDGSSVLFQSDGSLAPGATEGLGQGNPYLWHAGATSYLSNLGGFGGIREISPDLRFIAIESGEEIYLYDAATDRLACVSCNPSGEPPSTGPGSRPGSSAIEERPARYLTDNGRLFFDTPEALLPADTNGAGGCPTSPAGNPSCTDVYEFEPAGVGTCADSAGCLFLISTGTGSLETFFVDASANGNDVFIREYQPLVPRDTGEAQSTIYDVRVDGGFPEPISPPACTTADSCRPSPQPQPSISTGSASSNYSGPGNEKPKPKKHQKKNHHKKSKRHTKRAANANRGGHK